MALSLLRKNKHGFDIVISDVHMPDMDGFKLLEHVGLEMDLPVIMMSADDSKSVVLKGVTHGAVDYLIKPVRMEVLKNIWQHVVRKKRSVPEHSRSVEETGERQQQQRGAEDDNASSGNNSRKRKEQEGEEDASNLKKPRVVWSVELHQQFVAAVNQLGVENGKINFLRPMGNLLKSKEVASSSEIQFGSTFADVHTRNEVNYGETDLTEDEIILIRVAEIEAVYASNGFGMREVDRTACEVQNKVDTTEDAALGEGEDDDDEDYDYNLWHDFAGRNYEWDDDKDED
ncbi:hypothetical protein Bca101_089332 [Brassica carinata]